MRGNNQKGFTLIEMVTSTGIFLVILVLLLNLFIVFSKAQRTAGARQKIVSEISFVAEKIAQEIRLNEIIYQGNFAYNVLPVSIYAQDGTPGISGKEVELGLQSRNNEEIYYFFNDGTDVRSDCASGVGLYRFDKTLSTQCQKLLQIPNIEIIDAGFFIAPSTNPYPDTTADCGPSGGSSSFNGYFCSCVVSSDCYSGVCSTGRCVLENVQPRVTVYIKIRDIEKSENIVVQTTSSGRVYNR